MAACYSLTPGTQVRKEDFGLLFYTMAGPRLYFLPSGETLTTEFFQGKQTLEFRLHRSENGNSLSKKRVDSLKKSLEQLKEKGVIHEC